MAILQVRDVDDGLYHTLKELARQEKRSLSQEVIKILEAYLSQKESLKTNPTDAFLELAGSWVDDRSSDEIISDIREKRSNSSRFGDHHALFD